MISEAIEILKTYTDGKDNTDKVEISVMQLNRIIKALEQQPTDAVDRVTIKEYLESFEVAQPKMGSSSENPNKCGKWRHYEGMLYCSKCGAEFYDEIMEYTGDEVPKYCPQCGQLKMQEVEDNG